MTDGVMTDGVMTDGVASGDMASGGMLPAAASGGASPASAPAEVPGVGVMTGGDAAVPDDAGGRGDTVAGSMMPGDAKPGDVGTAVADAPASRRPRGPSVGTIALAACLFVVGGVAVMIGLPFPDLALTWMRSDPRILGVVILSLVSVVVIIIAVIWSVATIIYNMTHPTPEP
ncbi:hypothetical protein [Bifidobacterium leontopitheci]|nr:hypothetical protein [Bifidobacterium leontopitheci]